MRRCWLSWTPPGRWTGPGRWLTARTCARWRAAQNRAEPGWPRQAGLEAPP